MDGLSIEIINGVSDDLRDLIGELDDTLAADYLPEQRHGLSLDALFEPHIRFFIARLDGGAVGCGGLALFDGFAEVKRMYVRPRARGRGIAQALLARIEREAAQNGLNLVRLETGDRQAAAMHLYERAGFRRCVAFGAYASMSPEATATSIFFEKTLR